MDVTQLIEPGRVHRRIYTDPDVFDMELDRIFGRVWLYVAHESQITAPGDFIRTYMGRHEVLVTRAEDASIHVLRNSCIHRGARLCTAEHGNRPNIVCPYHGWTYSPQGKLLLVPHPESYPAGFDSQTKQLTSAPRVSSYRGFVFASWAGSGEPLLDYLGPMTAAIDNLIDRAPAGEIEVAGGTFRLLYPGNWKLQIENANDTIHPSFVHASSVASARRSKQAKNPFDDGQTQMMLASNGFTQREWDHLELHGFDSGHAYMGGFYKSGILSLDTDDPVTQEYRQTMVDSYGDAKADEILGLDRFNNMIYPNITVNAQFHSIRIVQPLAVDKTLIQGYCFRLKGAPPAIFKRAVRFLSNLNSPASMIFADDVEVFERVQDGLTRAGTEWINTERGADTDTPEQPGEASSAHVSELPIRAMYKAWSRYMSAAPSNTNSETRA